MGMAVVPPRLRQSCKDSAAELAGRRFSLGFKIGKKQSDVSVVWVVCLTLARTSDASIQPLLPWCGTLGDN
jgi:hypothetical protein